MKPKKIEIINDSKGVELIVLLFGIEEKELKPLHEEERENKKVYVTKEDNRE